jgi:hypothetical protein
VLSIRDRLPKARRLSPTVLVGILIFVFTLSIFLISRIHQVGDWHYSMMVSQSLIDHGCFQLDQYALPRYEPVWHGYYYKNRNGVARRLRSLFLAEFRPASSQLLPRQPFVV